MATDHNFKVKKGLHVLGSEGIYLTDTDTRLHEGNGNALRIETGTGYVDLGSMNSGWVHFQMNKNLYILPSSFVAVDGNLQPYTDSARTLGANDKRWSHAYADNVTVTDDVTIGGDLTVTGTTTTTNQNNLDVADNIIGLNRGATSNANDSGFIIERGSTGDNASIIWDESADEWVFSTTTAVPSATGNLSLTTAPFRGKGFWTTSSSIAHWGNPDGNTAYGTLTWDSGYAYIFAKNSADLILGGGGTGYANAGLKVSATNKVLVNGADDNSGKADFAVDTGGSSAQLSLHGGQIQAGSTDMNWNAKFAYVSGGNVQLGAWDDNIDIFTSGGGSATAKYINISPQGAGGGSTQIVRVFGGHSGTGGVAIHNGTANLSRGDLHYPGGTTDNIRPRLHVTQMDVSGSYPLIARFQAGNDADNTGGAILINHSNDRGLLLEGGRSNSDRGVGYLGVVRSSGDAYRIVALEQNGAAAYMKIGDGSLPNSHDTRLRIAGMSSGGTGTYSLRVTDGGNNSFMYIRDDGVISTHGSQYLYVENSGGMYVTNSIKARGGIQNDQGSVLINDDLVVNGDLTVGDTTGAEKVQLYVDSSDVTADNTGLTFTLSGSYSDGRYEHRFRKRDEGGGIPLYIDKTSATANAHAQVVRFGSYTNNSDEFEVYGTMSSDGYRINNTSVIDSGRRFYPANIQSSGTISFLNGSNGSSGSGAQGINVRHIYAGTTYASSTAGAGEIESLNGFKVAGTTRINSVGDGIFTSLYIGSNAIVDTNRNVTGATFKATGADTTPAGTTFANAVKGVSDSRTMYFDGNGTGVSTWYGVGNNPFAAIDCTDGVMDFWVNPSNGSWYNIFNTDTNGITQTYGSRIAIDSSGAAYYRADGGTNQWKYLSLQTNGSTNWDIATKNDDLSGALQFRIGGNATNRTYMDTSGNWTFSQALYIGGATSDWVDSNDELVVNGRGGFKGAGHTAAAFGRYNSGYSSGENGDIISFLYGSSGIGSIGAEGGDSVYMQGGTSSGAGLLFHGGAGKVLPVRNSASIDATIDLGQSSRRFKDLYLSGSGHITYVMGGEYYADGKKFYDMPSNSTERGPWNPLITALRTAGRKLYVDEEFHIGSNDVNVYNNSGGGTVTHTRENDTANLGQDAPNDSGKVIRVYYNGGTASPGFGGFYQTIPSEDNHTFVQIFQAKLPSGKSFYTAENAQGSNNTTYFLTSSAGTGKWEWYARVSHCGDSGTFSSGGHIYVSGGSGAFTWYLASCTVVDVTESHILQNRMFRAQNTASNSEPRFAFSGDTDTGLGYIGTNQVGIIAGGSRKQYWSSASAHVNNLSEGLRVGAPMIIGADEAFDYGDLALHVHGHAAIERGSALFLGVTGDNYNTWQAKFHNSSSTAYINAQRLIVDNTGYGSVEGIDINMSGGYVETHLPFRTDKVQATGLANRAFAAGTAAKATGAIHLYGHAGGTSGAARQSAITFSGAGTPSTEAQAGIMCSQNSSTGTSISIMTTDSYANGPKQTLSILDTGLVYANRGAYVNNYNQQWTGERNENLRFYSGTTGAAGILLTDSGGSFRAQLYGNGTDYGFLDGTWANWDLKKTTNGKLYFNGDTTYFLQPEHANSAKFRQFVNIGDSSNYSTNSGSWGARLNVVDNVHAKIEVGHDSDNMLSHWYSHNGHDSIKFGTSTGHDVEIQRAGVTRIEATGSGAYITGTLQATSDILGGTSSSNSDGQNNRPFRLDVDRSSYMVTTAGNTWGLFWAGNSGARYGTNGNGGPGNIWGNSGNPNEFAFVGSDSTAWTVYGNTGHTWQKGNFRMNGTLWEGLHGGSGTGTTHLNKVGGIRFGWSNSNYGHQDQHSIRSTYGNTYGDNITLNSYNHIRFNIDSNNNDSTSYFEVGHHGTDTASILMRLTSPSGNFEVDGNVTAYSSSISDAKYKDNIEPLKGSLDKVLQLRGVEFDWIATSRKGIRDIGFIAQEVEPIVPEVVTEQLNGVGEFSQKEEMSKSIAYDKLVPLLVESIKEQQKEIDELKSLINSIVENKGE